MLQSSNGSVSIISLIGAVPTPFFKIAIRDSTITRQSRKPHTYLAQTHIPREQLLIATPNPHNPTAHILFRNIYISKK